VQHHEQYNEMLGSKHSVLDCIDCHDPHKTLHPQAPNRDEAILIDCQSCHIDDADAFYASDLEHADAGVECIDCHMPKAVKSAAADPASLNGDVRSHIFTINTRADAKQFSDDGKFANPYLTLDYMCRKCHTDRDQAWMAENAKRIHFPDVSNKQCFDCHSGNGLLEQARGGWENSVHASGNNIDYTNRGGGSDCTKCHNHQGFVEFLRTGTVSAPYNVVTSINCQTCHLAHESGSLDLRTESPYTLANGEVFDHGEANLCVNCHHSSLSADAIVDNQVVSSRWGPHHGPQGDLFNVSNGFEYAGYDYSRAPKDHASELQDGCVYCHMSDPRIHEGYKVGGHSMNMVDEESGYNLVPLCATSGCHSGVTTYDFAAKADYDGDGTIEGAQTEIEGLIEELGDLLTEMELLGADGLPKSGTIPDKRVAGAIFNYLLAEEDRSDGVHNYKYIKDLLVSSISFLETGDPNGTSLASTVSGLRLASAH
jgi:hypothetical protein